MEEALRIRILNTLRRVEQPEGGPRAMLAALRELDAVVVVEKGAIPGDLEHYLSRRSYEKARLFLENSGPIPRGSCGRGAGV